MNWLTSWYHNHFQKSLATILIMIDTLNLGALEFFQQDLIQFFGPNKGPMIFSGIRICLGVLIFLRATQKRKEELKNEIP